MRKPLVAPLEHGRPADPGRRIARLPLLEVLTRSPARQFHLVSFLVLLSGMLGMGWWLGQQIEQRVILYTVTINAHYVESIVAPLLQDLDGATSMSQRDVDVIDTIITQTTIGADLAALVVWSPNSQVLYSTDATQIGQVYPSQDDLSESLAGATTWEINSAHDDVHIPQQIRSQLLLAMYSPIRDLDDGRVIAVAEFYEPFDAVRRDIVATQQRTWLLIGTASLLMYLMLVGFVQRSSNTIVRQEAALSAQVEQLTALLRQNSELHDRVQQAAHRGATSNERVLRRISADVHDGPLQVLGAAMLHFDRVAADYEANPDLRGGRHLAIAQRSLSQAIGELRAICSGLGLPQIDPSTPQVLIDYVARNHEQRTGTEVQVQTQNLPEDLIPSIKVSLYRILQEGLSNAARHGRGIGQRVRVVGEEDRLQVEIADSGPGFDPNAAIDGRDHLGLAGIRDRVESLGGQFSVISAPGQGTRLQITLPLSDSISE